MEQSTRAPRAYRFGVFEVDLRAGELRKQGLKIKLQDQPFQVLATLLERPADVVTREELRTKLWPADTFVDFDHGINLAIHKIREALGDSAENPRFIETLGGRGYRFLAPVERVAADSEPPRSVSTPVTNALASPSVPDVESRRAVVTKTPKTHADEGREASAHDVEDIDETSRKRRLVWAWGFRGMLAVILLAGLGLLGYFAWKLLQPPESKIMMVVLPFENLSGDPEQKYFVYALTDEITAQLAGLSPDRLGIIARTTAMRYEHAAKDVRQIGNELGVQYALEGTVFRTGDQVRITAQLVKCKDQTHLWAKDYEGDQRDILKLQSDVARAIAEGIQLKLTPAQQARLASPRSVNPEAFEAYAHARYHWNKRSPEELQRAIGYFTKAIEKDPKYAPAYAGLADTYCLLASNGYDVMRPREAMPKAKEAALKAVEVDDTLAEAHTSLANVRLTYDWNWTEAEKEFKRALVLNPGYPTAHQWYALYLRLMGRSEEAVAEAKEALKLDPFSVAIHAAVAEGYNFSRQYDQVIERCQKTLDMEPNYYLTYLWLGRAYEEKGKYEDALAVFEKGRALSGDSPVMVMALAHAYATAGRKAEAQKVLNELRALSKKRYVPALYVAAVYGGLGDKDKAFQWLEKAFEERADHLIYLQREPMADPVRSDPRFQDLVRRIGLPP